MKFSFWILAINSGFQGENSNTLQAMDKLLKRNIIPVAIALISGLAAYFALNAMYKSLEYPFELYPYALQIASVINALFMYKISHQLCKRLNLKK